MYRQKVKDLLYEVPGSFLNFTLSPCGLFPGGRRQSEKRYCLEKLFGVKLPEPSLGLRPVDRAFLDSHGCLLQGFGKGRMAVYGAGNVFGTGA